MEENNTVKLAALGASIAEAYNKGYTMAELGKAYGVDRKAIAKVLATHNTVPRKRGRRANTIKTALVPLVQEN